MSLLRVDTAEEVGSEEQGRILATFSRGKKNGSGRNAARPGGGARRELRVEGVAR